MNKKVSLLLLLTLLILGSLKAEEMNSASQKALGGCRLIYHGDRNRKQLALTIDDGWWEDDPLLELLDWYDIRCTVFIPGRVAQARPSFITKLQNYGHEICTHTQTHSHLTRLTEEQIREEMREGQRILTEMTGQTIMYMRPPGGQIDERSARVIHDMGYSIIMWDSDVQGYWKDQTIISQLEYLRKKEQNGSIILSHFGARLNTYEVLKIYIPEALDRGYEFVTVSELLKPGP